MIKISIMCNGTTILVEANSQSEISEVVSQIPQIIEGIEGVVTRTQLELPFEQKVEVKGVAASSSTEKLSEEELDLIEKAKKEANKRREEDQNEINGKLKIANENLAKEMAEKEAAKAAKAAAEKAAAEKEAADKAAAEEKANDEKEAEERASRAKARRRKAAVRTIAEEDGAMTPEMEAEAKADAEEEQEDLIAEEIYKEKYAVVVAPAKTPEPVKEETKTVKVKTKTEVVEEKVAPKVETEKPAETKVEEATEVKKKGIDRVIEMFDAQIAAKTDPYKVTRKAIEVLVSEGSGKAKAVVDIMQNVDAESRWKLAINRPEVLKDKFGLSKEEVATVLETMKPYFGLK